MKLTLLLSATLLVLTFILAMGAWEWIGAWIVRLFPYNPRNVGDKVAIYLNGRYNRTATITKVTANKVFIYDNRIDLPLNYRGRFYGVGISGGDGSRLVYVGNRNHYPFVRTAEIIRKVFSLQEDLENFNFDGPDTERLPQAIAEEGVSDEM